MAARVRCHTGDHLPLEIVGANLLGVEGFEGVLVSLRHSSRVGAQGNPRGWFEAVLAQASDLIEIVDADGRLLWANGPVEDLVGLPAEALVGLTLSQITNPEDLDDLDRWWRYVLGVPGTAHRSWEPAANRTAACGTSRRGRTTSSTTRRSGPWSSRSAT